LTKFKGWDGGKISSFLSTFTRNELYVDAENTTDGYIKDDLRVHKPDLDKLLLRYNNNSAIIPEKVLERECRYEVILGKKNIGKLIKVRRVFRTVFEFNTPEEGSKEE
jgi:hypothetical protein